jgi:dCMP deaminase
MKASRARRPNARSAASAVRRRVRAVRGSRPRAKTRRVDWHTYFMNIARQVASRSTCDRKHVGAVIVRDRTILSTGYNGSIRGMPHCDDAGHDLEAGHCVATIHAEANAILQAAKNGVTIDGAEIYMTASPCWNCFKLIANAGISRIYYGEFYRDAKSIEVARRLGIELIDLGRSGGAGPARPTARGRDDRQAPDD